MCSRSCKTAIITPQGRGFAPRPCLLSEPGRLGKITRTEDTMKNVLYGKCVKCGNCVTVCKFHAVEKK